MSGGKGKASGPKMKPLVWQKVPKNRLKGTVWQDIKDAAEQAEPSFDAAKFEALFTIKAAPEKPTLSRSASSSGATSTKLLDPKRAMNLSINLAKLRLPVEQIRKAVIDLDVAVLSHENVDALQKCVPTPEEVELVMASADATSLGYAEQFVLSLGTVPRLKARLDCFAYKHTFNQQLHALYADAGALTTAAKQLVSCAPLKQLLGMLLHLGNALNAGSFRSGAEGFKLECLPRLLELKANEGALSLLHFALTSVHESAFESADAALKSPIPSLAEHVPAVRGAAKLSTTELLEEAARLEQGLKLVASEIGQFRADTAKGAPNEGDAAACDRFVAAEKFLLMMDPFYEGCKGQVEELGRATAEMSEAQGKMKVYFSEDSKASIDEVYSRWASFLGQVETAVAHINDDRKRAEAKQARNSKAA